MKIKERMKKNGIDVESLVETALEMYIYDSEIGTRRKLRGILRKEFNFVLGDINVASLVLAGFLLEEEMSRGVVCTKEKYISDPVELIADEILGIQIAVYIAGTRALFEFERFDKAKPGILKDLPPFLDDTIAGLISGVLVKVCSGSR